ncbi:uncharacterized protein J3R85_004322 [Psidium guajava]|nr:uncharacterized protein J3R85_004322 [Psidium guajava]
MEPPNGTPPSSPSPPPPPRPSATPLPPLREDCWTEGSTFALIEAWGDRYRALDRGNFSQQDWQDVADSVNSRPDASSSGKPRRTGVQCKNRIDTLKKKFKLEKARVSDPSDGPGSGYLSPWPFFAGLDALIGSNFPPREALAVADAPAGSPIEAEARGLSVGSQHAAGGDRAGAPPEPQPDEARAGEVPRRRIVFPACLLGGGRGSGRGGWIGAVQLEDEIEVREGEGGEEGERVRGVSRGDREVGADIRESGEEEGEGDDRAGEAEDAVHQGLGAAEDALVLGNADSPPKDQETEADSNRRGLFVDGRVWESLQAPVPNMVSAFSTCNDVPVVSK